MSYRSNKNKEEVPRSPEEDQSHSTIPAGALQAAKILGYQCRHNGVNATVNRKQRELQGHGRLNAFLATRAHIKESLTRKRNAFGWNKHVYGMLTLRHSGNTKCFHNLNNVCRHVKVKSAGQESILQFEKLEPSSTVETTTSVRTLKQNNVPGHERKNAHCRVVRHCVMV